MKTNGVLIFAVAGVCALALTANAQSGRASLRGVVFDSLRGRPLRDAFVTVAGVGHGITTDSRGRFRFDSVETGVRAVTAQHALFDSIGLSGLTVSATVSDDGSEVRLAVPSFETLWRLTCRGDAPSDSGIVFGTIRRAAGGGPVAGASIDLLWSDLTMAQASSETRRPRRPVDRVWRVETRSNARGGYAVCGVPLDANLQVRASLDSSASGSIDMPPSDVRVRRRDLLIGRWSDSTNLGTIVGVVTDPDGHAMAGARIATRGAADVRSDTGGRFTLNGVRPGTREVEVTFIGVAPTRASADVKPGDTASVTVQLSRAVALAAMKTTAVYGNRVFAAEFNERRKHGFGYARDSMDVSRYNDFVNVLRDIPTVHVKRTAVDMTITVPDGKGGFCEPDVLIDGGHAMFAHLIDLLPNEIGGVEVYPRSAQIPSRYAPVGIQPLCGMILVWTKYGFRNR